MSDLRSSLENATVPGRKWPWVAGVAVLVLIAAGIGLAGTRGGGSRADAAGDGRPVRGGTLQFALIDYQRSPDPQWGTNYAESLIGNNVTDKLTWQDPKTGEITPWLATSWSYNKDLTEFTFHLRHDVTFSDGTPFNAAAVQANLDQYVHGDKALGILPNGATLLPGYLETQTPDDYTAVVRFQHPLAGFLQASSFTANAQPGFLSLSTLKLSAKERNDPTKVIGTGPFVYESWQQQVRTVLVKRKGYHSAVQQGKALYIGLSNYPADRAHEAAGLLRRAGVPLLVHQPRYSLFDRRPETGGLLQVAEEDGFGLVVYSPLAQGLLTDKYLDGVPAGARAQNSTFLSAADIDETYRERARALHKIAEQRGQSLAQLALQWVLRRPQVTSALIGASSPGQLDRNIRALDFPSLTDEELALIDEQLP